MTAAPISRADDNVATVRQLYDLEQRQDLDVWARLWTETAVVTFPLAVDPAGSAVVGRDALVELTRQKFADRERVSIALRVEPMRDERRVLAHLDAAIDFASGEHLDLALLCLFTFAEDGRIAALDEYVNQAAVTAQLGDRPARPPVPR